MPYITDETRAAVARDMETLRKAEQEKKARIQREMQADWERIRSQTPIPQPASQPKPQQLALIAHPGIKAPFPRRIPVISPELIRLCGGSVPTAERLVTGHLACNPGKSEKWANEKAILDLVRDRR